MSLLLEPLLLYEFHLAAKIDAYYFITKQLIKYEALFYNKVLSSKKYYRVY